MARRRSPREDQDMCHDGNGNSDEDAEFEEEQETQCTPATQGANTPGTQPSTYQGYSPVFGRSPQPFLLSQPSTAIPAAYRNCSTNYRPPQPIFLQPTAHTRTTQPPTSPRTPSILMCGHSPGCGCTPEIPLSDQRRSPDSNGLPSMSSDSVFDHTLQIPSANLHGSSPQSGSSPLSGLSDLSSLGTDSVFCGATPQPLPIGRTPLNRPGRRMREDDDEDIHPRVRRRIFSSDNPPANQPPADAQQRWESIPQPGNMATPMQLNLPFGSPLAVPFENRGLQGQGQPGIGPSATLNGIELQVIQPSTPGRPGRLGRRRTEEGDEDIRPTARRILFPSVNVPANQPSVDTQQRLENIPQLNDIATPLGSFPSVPFENGGLQGLDGIESQLIREFNPLAIEIPGEPNVTPATPSPHRNLLLHLRNFNWQDTSSQRPQFQHQQPIRFGMNRTMPGMQNGLRIRQPVVNAGHLHLQNQIQNTPYRHPMLFNQLPFQQPLFPNPQPQLYHQPPIQPDMQHLQNPTWQNAPIQQPLVHNPAIDFIGQLPIPFPNQQLPLQNPEIDSTGQQPIPTTRLIQPNWHYPTGNQQPLIQHQELTSTDGQFGFTSRVGSLRNMQQETFPYRSNVFTGPNQVVTYIMYSNRHAEALLSRVDSRDADQPTQVYLRNTDTPNSQNIYQVDINFREELDRADNRIVCRVCGRRFASASLGKIHELTCVNWVYRLEEREFGISVTPYQQAVPVEPLTIHNLREVMDAGRVGERIIIQDNDLIEDPSQLTAPVWIFLDENYTEVFENRPHIRYRCMNDEACYNTELMTRGAPLNSFVDFFNHMFVYHLCCEKCGDLRTSYRGRGRERAQHNLERHPVEFRFGEDYTSIIINPPRCV